MRPDTLSLPRLVPFSEVRHLTVVVVEGPNAGDQVVASDDTVTIGSAEGNDVRLADQAVSRYHLKLVARRGGIDLIDLGSTNGSWVGSTRVERGTVDVGSIIGLGRSKIRIAESKEAIVQLHPADALGQMRGRSNGMRSLMALVKKLAAADSAVLLIGESGTGKELVARALHDESARRDKPFVTVDCGAIADSLITSELFGHERGAFTGAERQHLGAFERADGGTVFLDEIGELSPALQTHLLGVLERRRIRRVGGSKDLPIDVRVLSATNRDVRAEVNKGTFRLDLFYRLAVVCLELPPLRDRGEDVPLLIQHFLQERGYHGEVEELFPPSMMDRLRQHPWPGNVRELRNLVEATLATGESLPPIASQAAAVTADDDAFGVDYTIGYKEARAALLHDFEQRYLTRLLERAGGNVSQAARDADMTRSHLFELLRKHGMN